MIGGKWSKQDCGLSEKTIYFRLLSIDAKGFQGKQEKIMFNSWLRCIMSDGLLSVCKRRTSSVYRNHIICVALSHTLCYVLCEARCT